MLDVRGNSVKIPEQSPSLRTIQLSRVALYCISAGLLQSQIPFRHVKPLVWSQILVGSDKSGHLSPWFKSPSEVENMKIRTTK
jgi:hypothetical protein